MSLNITKEIQNLSNWLEGKTTLDMLDENSKKQVDFYISEINDMRVKMFWFRFLKNLGGYNPDHYRVFTINDLDANNILNDARTKYRYHKSKMQYCVYK